MIHDRAKRLRAEIGVSDSQSSDNLFRPPDLAFR